MELSSLAGNARIKEQLSRRGEGRSLSHAYIIAGPVGSGRHTLARLLAAAMVCTGSGSRPCGGCNPCKKVAASIHPDVITITGGEDGKPIPVRQIRDLQKDAHVRPNEGERKVYLLEGADRMKDEAQNAMLKLLEEGPGYAAFLLLAENAGGLLQTIRSRCEVLELVPAPVQECQAWLARRYPEKDPNAIRSAALNCQGLLGRAVEELEGMSPTEEVREMAVQLANALEKGSESQVFEATMVLEKLEKDKLARLLEYLVTELTHRMGKTQDRRRLFRGVELARQLQVALSFNTNAGQMAGWLCAGLFDSRIPNVHNQCENCQWCLGIL